MSLHAAYAKHVLHRHVQKKYNLLNNRDPHHALPRRSDASDLPKHLCGALPGAPTQNPRVGIIGAGAAGLAVALNLHKLGGYESIEILEASPRHGGRCYTFTFQEEHPCNHNYYDVGAMRIPNIPTMESTFNMIRVLQDEGQEISPAPYTYAARDSKGNRLEPTMYAYGKIDGNDPSIDQFNTFMRTLLQTHDFPIALPPSGDVSGMPSGGATATEAQKTFDQAFTDFINDPSHPDKYSTRAYLMTQASPNWTYAHTEMAETLDTSTGLFDQAFMETICDFYDFEVAKTWQRIDGGMSKLTDALFNVVTNKGITVTPNTPVIAMKDSGSTIDVMCIDQSGNQPRQTPKTFDVVFNTTSFGCLQRMDLEGLNLSVDTLTGIRALSYDRATKVAIKFRHPWWQWLIPHGGVSSSDLPISNVVYPSWNDGDGPTVIIVSYSWAQDASRMAALIASNNQESTNVNDPMVQLIFQNLAKLWSKTPNPKTQKCLSLKELEQDYLAHHSFGWSHDAHAAGGFALFGPGQFENMYPQFLQPLCGNKLWICGEAVSAHHAWISGAFDSAYLAVQGWNHGRNNAKAKQRLKESSLGAGRGKNVAEMDETLLYLNVELALTE